MALRGERKGEEKRRRREEEERIEQAWWRAGKGKKRRRGGKVRAYVVGRAGKEERERVERRGRGKYE